MIFEVREVFKNDPEARGFVFPEYEPENSYGDPFHGPFSLKVGGPFSLKVGNHLVVLPPAVFPPKNGPLFL